MLILLSSTIISSCRLPATNFFAIPSLRQCYYLPGYSFDPLDINATADPVVVSASLWWIDGNYQATRDISMATHPWLSFAAARCFSMGVIKDITNAKLLSELSSPVCQKDHGPLPIFLQWLQLMNTCDHDVLTKRDATDIVAMSFCWSFGNSFQFYLQLAFRDNNPGSNVLNIVAFTIILHTREEPESFYFTHFDTTISVPYIPLRLQCVRRNNHS